MKKHLERMLIILVQKLINGEIYIIRKKLMPRHPDIGEDIMCVPISGEHPAVQVVRGLIRVGYIQTEI